MDVWLTVPATWQDQAKKATKLAAQHAGFANRPGDTLNVITEPEAASIAILTASRETHQELVQPGKFALVLDLGGGTIDIQMLRIKKVKPTLELEEPIPGKAAKAGSTYIDINFHTWMEETFGAAFTGLGSERIGHGSKFMQEWEDAKTAFNGKDLKKVYKISLPSLGRSLDSSSDRFDKFDNCVTITGDQMAKLFQPTLETAFKLIEEQIESLKVAGLELGIKGAHPHMMLLAGGLGSSVFVWQKIKDFCRDKLKSKCEVLTDVRAWSAVVRGAAIRGLNGNAVLSKKAKRCYGIGVHRRFKNGTDDQSDAFDCSLKGKRADGYIHWFIIVGNTLTPNKDFTTDLYEVFDKKEVAYQYTLYSTCLPTPPVRVDNPDVRRDGTMEVHVDESPRRSASEDGTAAKEEIKLRLVAKVSDTSGVIELFLKDGRNVRAQAKIDYAEDHRRRN